MTPVDPAKLVGVPTVQLRLPLAPVRELVVRAMLKDGPTRIVEVPTFFRVTERVDPPLRVPEGVPVSEYETSWRDGVAAAEPTRPVAADATTPPTARTAPMMMKRSRDWDIARLLQVVFIGGIPGSAI